MTSPNQTRDDFYGEEPTEICECNNDRCRNPIYRGERNWDFDGEWFCSARCIAKHIGAFNRYVE